MLDLNPDKDIVRRAYKKVLERQPDTNGLEYYSNLIKDNRITEEQLFQVLKNSDEYKSKHTYLNIDSSEFVGRIAYIQLVYDNDFSNCLENLKSFKRLNSQITCIVVYDDTISMEQIQSLWQAGALMKYSKWVDDLPRQRNVALQEARRFKADWVLSSDPDEHFNDDFIKDIQKLIGSAENNGYDLLKVNVHDISKDTHKETIPDYSKDLVFKLKQGVAFQGSGNLPLEHEGIVGLQKSIRLPSKYFYNHVKSRLDDLEDHTRCMFNVGAGPNWGAENPTWIELREITDKLNIQTWRQFYEYFKKGNIDSELKDFLIKHRNDHFKDGDQNVRAMFQFYFQALHPEENTDNLVTYIDYTIRPGE